MDQNQYTETCLTVLKGMNLSLKKLKEIRKECHEAPWNNGINEGIDKMIKDRLHALQKRSVA